MNMIHLIFVSVVIVAIAADLPHLSGPDVVDGVDTNVTTTTTDLSSTSISIPNHSQRIVFWIFVSTLITLSLLVVLIRSYSMWQNEGTPNLSKPRSNSNGNRMVYGDLSINKSGLDMVHDINKVNKIGSPRSNITDDIEEYVMRELCEIDASYPGYPRSSSIGYIEAIYARHSGGNEEEMSEMRNEMNYNEMNDYTQNEMNESNIRIQINGQDVTCTKNGIEITPIPWSPTPTDTDLENIAPDEFIVSDGDEGDEVTEGVDHELDVYHE